MYTRKDFRTKKELKAAVEAYNNYVKAKSSTATMTVDAVLLSKTCPPEPVRLYAPGLGKPVENGTEYVEGPHYPKPHTWYASVTVKDGIVIKVK